MVIVSKPESVTSAKVSTKPTNQENHELSIRSDEPLHKHHGPEAGVQCPDIVLLNDDGSPTSLSELAGLSKNGILVINFPNLENESSIHAAKSLTYRLREFEEYDIDVFGMASVSPKEIRTWKGEHGVNIKMVSGRHHYTLMEAATSLKQDEFILCFFILSKNGKVVQVKVVSNPMTCGDEGLFCIRKYFK